MLLITISSALRASVLMRPRGGPSCSSVLLLAFFQSPYWRAALIAAGITSPDLLPQLLRVNVITDAMSTSESCFHGGIAVPGLPFSTMWIWSCGGPVTTLLPSRAGNAPATPLPFAWWQAAQFDA